MFDELYHAIYRLLASVTDFVTLFFGALEEFLGAIGL